MVKAMRKLSGCENIEGDSVQEENDSVQKPIALQPKTVMKPLFNVSFIYLCLVIICDYLQLQVSFTL